MLVIASLQQITVSPTTHYGGGIRTVEGVLWSLRNDLDFHFFHGRDLDFHSTLLPRSWLSNVAKITVIKLIPAIKTHLCWYSCFVGLWGGINNTLDAFLFVFGSFCVRKTRVASCCLRKPATTPPSGGVA